MVALLVGIDWADQKHDACIMNESGAVLKVLTFSHLQEGLELLRGYVEAESGNNQVVCAIETPRGLLVNFLLEQGWTVYAINPKSVDRYRERIRTAKVKSDQLDAWLLADILRTDRHLHRPMLPDSELVRELQELTRGRETLVQESVRLNNQLQACLKTYWPESLKLFPKLDQPWALGYLAKYPSAAEAKRASITALQSFLRTHRYPQWRKKAEDIYSVLREPHVNPPAYIVRTHCRQLLHVVRQLETVVQDLKAYDKEIERLLSEHPDGQLFLSLPGAGPNLAARLLAEIGDNRDRYATANCLQCEAGTAPVTRKSGKLLSTVKFRRACKKPLRNALQLFAGSSLRLCPWARTLYAEQRSKGKNHPEAIRTVAHKWAKILFGMLKSNSCYDEQRWLAAKERFLQNPNAA